MNANLKNAKILIVDDQIANVEVVESYLLMENYTNIVSLTDAREVMKLYDEFQPDLILLDLLMPYFSGFEIMEMLKEKVPDSVYLPILILTADVSTETKRKALLSGASDFLTKPFDLIELQARVNTHLEIRFKNEQINEYAEQLKVHIAIKDKFFSIIAHDVRNPFVGIENYIKILLKLKNYSPDKIESDLQLIYNSALHGHELLENLLKWSKTQIGNMEISKTKFKFADLILSCTDHTSIHVNNKQINVITDFPENIFVNTDHEMLDTIFRNLITNAVKFTPHNGTVKVLTKVSDSDLLVHVIDDGIGISEDEQKKIFSIENKLTTRKGTDGEKGTGLGLILCNEFIRMLNGTISVQSELNIGSTFTVNIPGIVIES